MKTIGVIGGMSWESTAVYYRLFNQMTRDRLGGLHSADLLLCSVDFAPIAAAQASGDWNDLGRRMGEAAKRLEQGGAECIVIATNTMHKLIDDVRAASSLPVIHIADGAAVAIKAAGLKKPLLLATRFTMEQDFYRGYLFGDHGIECAVPDEAGRTVVHDIIYQELCQGVIRDDSKQAYLDIIAREIEAGADGVIFGCTEVGLLISQSDLQVPAFDTCALHVAAALDVALA